MPLAAMQLCTAVGIGPLTGSVTSYCYAILRRYNICQLAMSTTTTPNTHAGTFTGREGKNKCRHF